MCIERRATGLSSPLDGGKPEEFALPAVAAAVVAGAAVKAEAAHGPVQEASPPGSSGGCQGRCPAAHAASRATSHPGPACSAPAQS